MSPSETTEPKTGVGLKRCELWSIRLYWESGSATCDRLVVNGYLYIRLMVVCGERGHGYEASTCDAAHNNGIERGLRVEMSACLSIVLGSIVRPSIRTHQHRGTVSPQHRQVRKKCHYQRRCFLLAPTPNVSRRYPPEPSPEQPQDRSDKFAPLITRQEKEGEKSTGGKTSTGDYCCDSPASPSPT